MASKLALEKAGQVWTDPRVATRVMDVELAEVFAETLDEIWGQPWLGNATTGQLIDEIRARGIQIQHEPLTKEQANYKTVGNG